MCILRIVLFITAELLLLSSYSDSTGIRKVAMCQYKPIQYGPVYPNLNLSANQVYPCTHLVYYQLDITNGTIDRNQDTILDSHFIGDLKRSDSTMKVLMSVKYTDEAAVDISKDLDGFTKSTAQFLRAHELDGMELDTDHTEFSTRSKRLLTTQIVGLVKYLTKISTERKKTFPLVTVTIKCSLFEHFADMYDIDTIKLYVDYVIVMSIVSPWEVKLMDTKLIHPSPLYFKNNVQQSQHYYMMGVWSEGVPRHKMVMAVPSYGLAFGLKQITRHAIGDEAAGFLDAPPLLFHDEGYVPYFELCRLTKTPHLSAEIDQNDTGTFMYGRINEQMDKHWIGFEDTRTVSKKASYIQSKGFIGTMVFGIQYDDMGGACGEGLFPLSTRLYTDIIGHRINRKINITDDKDEPDMDEPDMDESKHLGESQMKNETSGQQRLSGQRHCIMLMNVVAFVVTLIAFSGFV